MRLKRLISEDITGQPSYLTLAKEFAEILQERVIQYYKDSVDAANKNYPADRQIPYDVHKANWDVKVKPGQKWIKIDTGSSGKFMLNTETGHLHFIKGYGTPDLKKDFGNMQGIIDNKDNWWYDGYSISPVGKRSGYGFAGRIDGETREIKEGSNDGRFENVVFLQGEEADEPLKILDEKGEDDAIEYLKQWHNTGEHETNSKVGAGASDYTYSKDGYLLIWNTRLGYIGLEYDTYYNKTYSFDENKIKTESINRGENKITSLTQYAKEVIKKYPNIKRGVIDFVEMAIDEIQDGGSEDHECDMAYDSIEDLISAQKGIGEDIVKKEKYYMGDVPAQDDFRDKIIDVFVDGKTKMGPWANMSLNSWKKYGVGKLGTGYGQMYKKQQDGQWLKIDG